MGKRKVKVYRERQVNTYAYLYHASRVVLKKAAKEPEGSFYQLMSSLIFTAFTLEAFLNHIGQHIFKCWDDLERLSPLAKLNLATEKLGIEKDYGERPYQTIQELFQFRNSIAHGKSTALKSENQSRFDHDTSDHYSYEPLKTPWEKYCTLKNAERALEDVELIVEEIHEATGKTDEFPFDFGMESALSTLLPEEG